MRDNFPTLHPDEHKIYLERLKSRVKRLNTFVSHNAPSVVIANEVVLVYEAASCLYGPYIKGKETERLISRVRENIGCCTGCGCFIFGSTNLECEVCAKLLDTTGEDLEDIEPKGEEENKNGAHH